MTRTIWLTGLPGSGKSTLAQTLARSLASQGRDCMVLEGEESQRGYSVAACRANTLSLAEAARLANSEGAYAIVAATSPMSADRAKARAILGARKMIEVYLSTPMAICEKRDTKGLYRRARDGEIDDFVGIDAPYQVPRRAQLVLDTFALSVKECEARILRLLAPSARAARLAHAAEYA